MQELIKRIDEEITEHDTEHINIENSRERDIWNNGYDVGTVQGLAMAKAIIQSSQKEPLQIKCDHIFCTHNNRRVCEADESYYCEWKPVQSSQPYKPPINCETCNNQIDRTCIGECSYISKTVAD